MNKISLFALALLTLADGAFAGTPYQIQNGQQTSPTGPALTSQSSSASPSTNFPPNSALSFNLFNITTDNVDPTSAPGGNQNVLGLNLQMVAGGSNTKGNHAAILGSITVNSTPSVAGDYVGVWGLGKVTVNLGGTSGTPAGSIFGANPQAVTTAAATNMVSVVGQETDVTAGVSPRFRFGENIVSLGAGTNGTTIDAALAIGANTTPFTYGIDFTNFNGGFPISSTGIMFGAEVGGTVNYGINLSNITCALLCYVSGGFQDNGIGTTKTFSATTNAAHTISSASGSTAYEQFEVGATLKWFMGNNGGNAFTLWDQTNSGQVIGATSAGNTTVGEPSKALTLDGAITTTGISTTGTIAGSVCETAANLLLFEIGATGCTISLTRLKNIDGKLSVDDASLILSRLKPISFAMKETPAHHQLGFTAEDTQAADARLATFDGNGNLQAYDPNGIIAVLTVTAQDQKRQIIILRIWLSVLTFAMVFMAFKGKIKWQQ